MDTIVTFPSPEPELKIARPSAEKWAATLAEERLRLHEDQEALREREENLREYEARLRQLQSEIESGRGATNQAGVISSPTRSTPPLFQRPSSRAPFNEDPALQAAWEKLHRARELLEAEQRNLRDDRITIRELERLVKQREEALAEREMRLAEREALIVAATPATEQMVEEQGVSAVTRITRMPFDVARSVFGGKKAV